MPGNYNVLGVSVDIYPGVGDRGCLTGSLESISALPDSHDPPPDPLLEVVLCNYKTDSPW